MGKPVGKYVTVESPCLKENDVEGHEAVIKILTDELSVLTDEVLCGLGGDARAPVFVVGLGNHNVTPDALGPRGVSKTLVTRHLDGEIPVRDGMTIRPVSALAPGVMGTTGIETVDIIEGICQKIKPSLVIAVDALAARKVSRINSTVQITDAGLNPGAGMGNKRRSLSEASLRIPVIAIGVPTVVDAATLAGDTIDLMLEAMIQELPEGSDFLHMLQNLEEGEKYSLIKRLLEPYAGNMFVTPKEVDAVVDRLSNIIANAINITLHTGLGVEDINRFMY